MLCSRLKRHILLFGNLRGLGRFYRQGSVWLLFRRWLAHGLFLVDSVQAIVRDASPVKRELLIVNTRESSRPIHGN